MKLPLPLLGWGMNIEKICCISPARMNSGRGKACSDKFLLHPSSFTLGDFFSQIFLGFPMPARPARVSRFDFLQDVLFFLE
jgi:hypothetical protein